MRCAGLVNSGDSERYADVKPLVDRDESGRELRGGEPPLFHAPAFGGVQELGPKPARESLGGGVDGLQDLEPLCMRCRERRYLQVHSNKLNGGGQKQGWAKRREIAQGGDGMERSRGYARAPPSTLP